MSDLIASTMTFLPFPLEGALTEIKKGGFDTVELCILGSPATTHFDIAGATEESIDRCVATFERVGMKAHCLNIGGDFTVGQLENAFRLAQKLGAKILTYRCGSMVAPEQRAEALKTYTAFNTRLADLGDRYGVTFAIEAPHKRSIAETTAQIDEYWSMQDSRIQCTFDVAHLTYSGEDMLATARKYAHRVAQCHLRDAVKGNSLMRYGEGVVDFASFLKIFRDIGYTGKFSMEYPPDSVEDALNRLAYSKQFLEKFGF